MYFHRRVRASSGLQNFISKVISSPFLHMVTPGGAGAGCVGLGGWLGGCAGGGTEGRVAGDRGLAFVTAWTRAVGCGCLRLQIINRKV